MNLQRSNASQPNQCEVLIAGLARNVAPRIASNVELIRRACGLFGKVHFLVVESDSSDQTLAELSRLSDEVPNFRFIAKGNLRVSTPIRCERLAICRNTYLNELRDNALYANVSHMIVSDLDGVSRDLTSEAIDSCWRRPEPWDVCTANQSDYYYDVWTLRHPTWCPGDCWQEYHDLAPRLGKVTARELAVFSKMVHVPTNRAMIEVDSAFGGLAIYKREAIISSQYRGLRDDGTEICEHVPLSLQMRQSGYRIFINPSLINAHRTSHASAKKWFRRLRRSVWTKIRGEDEIKAPAIRVAC